tara:strand:- start:812 stop:1522 length:711 start_codon:yes stop_codon:yes gene_type:complete
MKIALCLHGKFDSLTDSSSKGNDGYEHIKNRILSKCNPDIFVHSWDEQEKENILGLYKPKGYKFQKQINFSPLTQHLGIIPNPPRTPNTILSHFYSVSESIKLACEKDNYDIIIKARFDLGRINRRTSGPQNAENPFPVQCITFDPHLNMNQLHMANWQYLDSDGPADMWFYSSGKNMSHLKDLYSFALKCFDLNSAYTKSLDSLNDLPNAVKLYKAFYIEKQLWEKKNLINTIFE